MVEKDEDKNDDDDYDDDKHGKRDTAICKWDGKQHEPENEEKRQQQQASAAAANPNWLVEYWMSQANKQYIKFDSNACAE